jgi:hypothetical protein
VVWSAPSPCRKTMVETAVVSPEITTLLRWQADKRLVLILE